MQDKVGEFQGLYVERLDKLKKILEGAQQKAKIIPDDPINFAAAIFIVDELAQTVETLGNYVTVLEEELRKRK